MHPNAELLEPTCYGSEAKHPMLCWQTHTVDKHTLCTWEPNSLGRPAWLPIIPGSTDSLIEALEVLLLSYKNKDPLYNKTGTVCI